MHDVHLLSHYIHTLWTQCTMLWCFLLAYQLCRLCGTCRLFREQLLLATGTKYWQLFWRTISFFVLFVCFLFLSWFPLVSVPSTKLYGILGMCTIFVGMLRIIVPLKGLVMTKFQAHVSRCCFSISR